MASSKLRLIILGAPGSGKGTISSRLVKEFRLNHLASGDLLRDHVAKKTDIGLKVKETLSKGQLISDELISKIVLNELNYLSGSSWLLDGFPRTIGQCRDLDKRNLKIDRVINLNVPFSEITNRLKHRWVHPGSGRVYNLEYSPPKVAFKDDVTGDPLVQREDDKEETVLRRLKIYEEQTKPIIEFFQSKKILETFTGNTSDYLWPLIKSNVHVIQTAKTNALANNPDQHLYPSTTNETRTHTGQLYEPSDYRRGRFEAATEKLVSKNIAMEMVAKQPVVVVDAKSAWSSGGGPLGHPKVYINLAAPGEHTCGYSGRRFIQKKYYDEAKHGKSISYDDYIEELKEFEQIAG